MGQSQQSTNNNNTEKRHHGTMSKTGNSNSHIRLSTRQASRQWDTDAAQDHSGSVLRLASSLCRPWWPAATTRQSHGSCSGRWLPPTAGWEWGRGAACRQIPGSGIWTEQRRLKSTSLAYLTVWEFVWWDTGVPFLRGSPQWKGCITQPYYPQAAVSTLNLGPKWVSELVGE